MPGDIKLLKETARLIMQEIIGEISDRSGLQQAWESIDGDVQSEIRRTWKRMILSHLRDYEQQQE